MSIHVALLCGTPEAVYRCLRVAWDSGAVHVAASEIVEGLPGELSGGHIDLYWRTCVILIDSNTQEDGEIGREINR